METKEIQVAYFQTAENNLDLAKTIVAFSNTFGGIIYIGKNPKGKTIGVVPSSELNFLSTLISSHIIGNVYYSIKEFEEKNKLVIQLIVSGSPEKGIKYVNIENKEKDSYIYEEGEVRIAPQLLVLSWKYASINGALSEKLSDEENDLLELIKSNPNSSITQIQKKSNQSIGKFEYNAVRLLNWKLVVLKLSKNSAILEAI